MCVCVIICIYIYTAQVAEIVDAFTHNTHLHTSGECWVSGVLVAGGVLLHIRLVVSGVLLRDMSVCVCVCV